MVYGRVSVRAFSQYLGESSIFVTSRDLLFDFNKEKANFTKISTATDSLALPSDILPVSTTFLNYITEWQKLHFPILASD